MEHLNAFKTKANEFATNQRGKVDSVKGKVPFSGTKGDGPRYFATIDTKDVSTFAPPPKRVGSIPGAKPEDRNVVPAAPTRKGTANPAPGNVRPPPPLPSRNQTFVNEVASPPTRGSIAPPPKLSRPPVASKSASPVLPSRRESTTAPGPSRETAASTTPAKETKYGQFGKTFGVVVDSTQANNLRNTLTKATSSTNSSTTTTSPPPRVTLADARTASTLAQKYRTDPKSISLSDAKAGLNVANKILPPPTDKSPPNRQDLQTAASLGQKWNKDPKSLGWSDLKAGYSVANKFRPEPTQTPASTEPSTSSTVQSPPADKYGIGDLKSRFGNVSLGGIKPAPALKSPPTIEPQPAAPAGKKRPPPPPPPPRPHVTNAAAPTPPAVNVSTKPTRSSSQPSWTPTDIPLNFEKQWYSTDPMEQIPYLSANPSKAISSSSIAASGSGYANHMTWLYTATFAIRWTTDLSRTFIRVTWSSDDPRGTVRGRQKHFPPPTPLGPSDLGKCAGLYGPSVVRFCQGQLGRQVGNGECWTLAHDALEFVQGVVQPKCMVSSGTIHGQCIFRREGTNTTFGALEGVRPGDIIQYLECKFERRQNGRLVYSSSAGAPDHTSVVTGVRGGVVEILHQNVGGVRKVQKGELVLDEMISGKLWIYRPVWESWAGGLEPKWEGGW